MKHPKMSSISDLLVTRRGRLETSADFCASCILVHGVDDHSILNITIRTFGRYMALRMKILVAFFPLLAKAAYGQVCEFGDLQRGKVAWGVNEGGCFDCVDGNQMALTGNELLDACRQMCTADPECAAFEVAESPVIPLNMYIGWGILNCCIEYAPVNSDRPQYIDAEGDDSNCGKAASCWTSVDKLSDCPVTDPSPKCVVNFPGYETEEELAELEAIKAGTGGIVDYINDRCPPDDAVFQQLLDVSSGECLVTSEFPTEECEFGDVDAGHILFGVNQGGCYACHEDNKPLEGDDLLEACRQMCTSDPYCVAYEVADAAILPLNEYRGDVQPRNCCIEHVPADANHDLFVAADAASNCGKEASCWSNIPRVESSSFGTRFPSCKLTPPSPKCDVVFPGYASEQEFSDTNDWVENFISGDCQADLVAQTLLDSASAECLAASDPPETTAEPTQSPESATAPGIQIESMATKQHSIKPMIASGLIVVLLSVRGI